MAISNPKTRFVPPLPKVEGMRKVFDAKTTECLLRAHAVKWCGGSLVQGLNEKKYSETILVLKQIEEEQSHVSVKKEAALRAIPSLAVNWMDAIPLNGDLTEAQANLLRRVLESLRLKLQARELVLRREGKLTQEKSLIPDQLFKGKDRSWVQDISALQKVLGYSLADLPPGSLQGKGRVRGFDWTVYLDSLDPQTADETAALTQALQYFNFRSQQMREQMNEGAKSLRLVQAPTNDNLEPAASPSSRTPPNSSGVYAASAVGRRPTKPAAAQPAWV